MQVVVTSKGNASPPFTAQGGVLSPAFFVFEGGPYVAAVHTDRTLVGPATLYPGASFPAKPGDILIYANGFGPTGAIARGSEHQSGNLVPQPVVKIGGLTALVT